MKVQLNNQQKLCDAIMSMWTRLSKECFQRPMESMPSRIRRGKRGPTQYCRVPNDVFSLLLAVDLDFLIIVDVIVCFVGLFNAFNSI